ncbi:MAG: hypothetical protein AAF799_10890 [Myxococcota bacterium]
MQVNWVRWLSHEHITDTAVDPAGAIVVAGHSFGDERVEGSPGLFVPRPTLTRFEAGGDLATQWAGFEGRTIAVAVDGLGRTYAMLELPNDAPGESAVFPCELRAFDLDDRVRWTKAWETTRCVWPIRVSDGAVVVRIDDTIEVFDLDGEPQWRRPVPERNHGAPRLGAGSIWITNTASSSFDAPPRAWRYALNDGHETEIALDRSPNFFDTWVVTPDGLLGVSVEGVPPRLYDAELFSLAPNGEERWSRPLTELPFSDAPGQWRTTHIHVFHRESEIWLTTNEEQIRHDSADPIHRRMLVQRRGPRGVPLNTMRRSFEPEPSMFSEHVEGVASVQCPRPTAVPWYGSIALGLDGHPDGSVSVYGRQGCRDSFVLYLDVPS